jgi:peptide/nickel transport system substrate-binding protein
VRNPRFHAWSNAAVPDGYPDEITIRLGVQQSRAVRAVEADRADYVFGTVTQDPRDEVDELFTRYAGQLHVSPGNGLVSLFLNTRVPPFDNVDARRAVNYAVDRRGAVAVAGGTRAATPACQILPPHFPAYRPYCPYTANPGPGRTWTAPNLAKAQRLVDLSHTRGMHVSVLAPRGSSLVGEARFVVPLLNKLGYRASLRLLGQNYFPDIADSRNRAQLGVTYWGPDYPAARDFLALQYSCSSFAPGNPNNINWSEFCDPHADRLMKRADQLQSTDPAAANTLWARAERRIVDQAAVLPLDNPKNVDFVSRRVGNYQFNPQWGALLDQLWVR